MSGVTGRQGQHTGQQEGPSPIHSLVAQPEFWVHVVSLAQSSPRHHGVAWLASLFRHLPLLTTSLRLPVFAFDMVGTPPQDQRGRDGGDIT